MDWAKVERRWAVSCLMVSKWVLMWLCGLRVKISDIAKVLIIISLLL